MLSKAEFRGAFIGLSAVLVVVLLITSVSPGIPGDLLLQSLRFHLVAVGFGLVAGLYLFGAKLRGTIMLAIVLGALAHGALLLIELHQRRDEPVGDRIGELTVLSYNVLSGNNRRKKAAQYVIDTAADVAVIMETPGIEPFLDEIAQTMPYRVGCADTTTCDISILSRMPIEGGTIRRVPPFDRERLAIAPITVDGQRVTIVAIHLSKPYFDEASWVELWQLQRALANIEGPVILAGDFNAAPWSDPLARLARASDLIPPPSHPATWPVRLGALGVPIDNMYSRGMARIEAIASGDNFGSNHRPLLATVGIYAEP